MSWEEKVILDMFFKLSVNYSMGFFLSQKCAIKLKLEFAPGLNSLAIYQWSKLAVAMEMDHPLLLLVWQKFFVLFLGRQVSQTT